MAFKADAEKIKRWREERHWSQEHLAELAGIGLRTLQRIEKGEPAAKETLMALASAFVRVFLGLAAVFSPWWMLGAAAVSTMLLQAAVSH